MGVSKNMGKPSKSSHFNRVFPYFHHPFLGHPYVGPQPIHLLRFVVSSSVAAWVVGRSGRTAPGFQKEVEGRWDIKPHDWISKQSET